MKKGLLFVFVLFLQLPLLAQDNTKSIAVLNFNYAESYDLVHEKKSTELQGIVSGLLVKDNRFTVVERGKLHMIDRERELQKSEDFIDGKIVQQGASIGADLMVSGFSNFTNKILTLSVYDVASGKLIGKEEFDLRYEYKLKSLVHQQLIQRYFPLPGIKLVKVLEGSNKAESVLIAAGSKTGIARKEKLEVKELIYEEIDGESFEREVTLGIIKVQQIENENFTICTVEEGGKLIAEKIAGGVKLFCKRTIK